MLLPYASERKPTRRPVVTIVLIGIMVAVMFGVEVSERAGGNWRSGQIFAAFGIVPAHFRPLTLFTYAFFHANPGHLLVNMLFLWVFGSGVEEAVGRVRYLLLYLAGGAVGGAMEALVTTTLLSPASASAPIVGASAACATLIGLYAVRYYRDEITFAGLPYRPHVVAVVLLFLLCETGAGLWNLASGAVQGSVAHWAHLFGFIFGLGCAYALRLEHAGERAYLAADAKQEMQEGDAGEAIKRWELLLLQEPDNTAARHELARAWLMLGDTEQAAAHYLQAIRSLLAQNQRADAARLYAELRETGYRGLRVEGPAISTGELFMLGSALEDREQYALAAETLRAVTVRHPDSPEAETALLKVIGLYIHRLHRREEAKILLRLFLERYPHSQWRTLAEDLRRAASEADTEEAGNTPPVGE
jgi:membrane associated rhomboid family serine protease